MIVIGYDLVSYLLHHPSAHCVTFKELFVCKSNNKTGDFEMNLPDFFLSHTSFSVKAVLFVGTPSPKRSFERTYADCRISGEKGFASRLNNSLD